MELYIKLQLQSSMFPDARNGTSSGVSIRRKDRLWDRLGTPER